MHITVEAGEATGIAPEDAVPTGETVHLGDQVLGEIAAQSLMQHDVDDMLLIPIADMPLEILLWEPSTTKVHQHFQEQRLVNHFDNLAFKVDEEIRLVHELDNHMRRKLGIAPFHESPPFFPCDEQIIGYIAQRIHDGRHIDLAIMHKDSNTPMTYRQARQLPSATRQAIESLLVGLTNTEYASYRIKTDITIDIKNGLWRK